MLRAGRGTNRRADRVVGSPRNAAAATIAVAAAGHGQQAQGRLHQLTHRRHELAVHVLVR